MLILMGFVESLCSMSGIAYPADESGNEITMLECAVTEVMG